MASTAMQVSKQHLLKLAETAKRAMTRAASHKDKIENITSKAVHTLEVTGASFGFGFLAGSSESGKVPEIMSVPVDLLGGAALHVAGFMGLGGKMGDHLHGFGDGALAHYGAVMGTGAGNAWKNKGNKVAGEGLSDDEARRYAQSPG